MSHKKRILITIICCIFACLTGLAGSVAGSLRYGMRDKAIETLAEEWDLPQMQVMKLAALFSMAQFLVLMVDTPGIDEEGAARLLGAEYTRDFIAAKLRDYRDDLLAANGRGNIRFEELVQLEREHEDEVSRDLGYHINASDWERYEELWDNLALTGRSALDAYRNGRPGVFALVRAALSGWFLAAAALAVAGVGVGLWHLHGRSFRGYGLYGMSLLLLGIVDCAMGALRGSAVEAVNALAGMNSNLASLALAPVCGMLLAVGAAFIVLGLAATMLCVFVRKRTRGHGK